MSMPSIVMSSASQMISAQASAVIDRKRGDHDGAVAPQYGFKRRIHSRLAQDSALAQIDMSELPVGIGKRELHRT